MRVLIIGAGAAGLTAAIYAAKSGAKVTVLEHENKTGKKILMTGNGKCNITNNLMNKDCFYGNEDFICAVLNQFDNTDTIKFFNDLGICTKEKNGYVYPSSEQASMVSARLREVCEYLAVKIKTNNHIKSIKKEKNLFVVDYGYTEQYDKIVLATGGMSFPTTGSDGTGYKLAEGLGHTIITPKPALTALICEKSGLYKAKGVRVKAKIVLDDKYIEQGELQITEYGVSGILVFNISRLAKNNSKLLIDFAPECSKEDLRMTIKNITSNYKEFNNIQVLSGLFNEKLAEAILSECNIKNNDRLDEKTVEKLVNNIKEFSITVKDKKGFDFAQVTMGGVDTKEINCKTMESYLVSGLYFAGEMIDVDGKCGGYNLQFAWSTGAIAGRNIF